MRDFELHFYVDLLVLLSVARWLEMSADGQNVSSIQFLSPSVDTHGQVNPSARVYELDRDTYELLDYTQYYFDLGNIPCTIKTPCTA